MKIDLYSLLTAVAGERGLFCMDRWQVLTNSSRGASSSSGMMLITFIAAMGSRKPFMFRLECIVWR